MSRFSLPSCLIAFIACCGTAHSQVTLPGVERSSLDARLAGRVLIEELNCVTCHQTDSADLVSSSRLAPRLTGVGGQINPDFLRAFIANPHGVKPGTTMPNLTGDLPEADRDSVAEDITHYLVSLNQGKKPFSLQAPDEVAAEKGEALFHSVGCAACHSPRGPGGQEIMKENSVPLGEMDGKYSVQSLSQFLKRPHATRPSGRMPTMGLTDAEAERIAHYLLRKTRVPGHLAYTLWRGHVWQGLEGEVEKEKAGLVEDFSLERFGKLPHHTAIRWQGFLKIETSGDYTFRLEMNGGSLRLNDEEIAGEKPSNRRGPKLLHGNAQLKPGWNRIELTYFHTGREPRLQFEMEGPGFPRQPIHSADLSNSNPMIPAFLTLEPDPTRVARGRDHFGRFNCAQCHLDLRDQSPPHRKSFPALALLDFSQGCLAAEPVQGVPRFELSANQKEQIRSALPGIEAGDLSDAQMIDKTLAALNCIACHERTGLGQIDPKRELYFTGTREALGNQGRLPPPLTQVGAKLTKEWMAQVLLHQGRQRPYLNTRMPQFGESHVGHLVERFDRVDQLEETEIPKVTDIRESKDAGYGMMGATGFSCIACHDFNGQKSAGAGAMDLVDVTRRLKKNWFHLYLREPYRFHPTVIMPSYWPGGQSSRKEILGGESSRQIEALWNYLADGRRAKLPEGLSRQSNELRVADETMMCRGRGTPAGYRGIGVGYPERISLAFDSTEMALRVLWKGEFADIDHGIFRLRGSDRIEFPQGVPFHRPVSMDEEWPYKGKTNHAFPQDHGYQFLGYSLDSKKRPTFRYRYGEITVADYFEDLLDAEGRAYFRRTLTFEAPSEQESFFFRIASGNGIEKTENGWRIDRLKIGLKDSPPAQVRDGDPGELLVPLKLPAGKTVIELHYQW